MQKKSDIIVLIAACITLITSFFPVARWFWRRHLVKHFDAKKEHFKELLASASWFENRAVKLASLRKQLIYAKAYEQLPDRFKLAEMLSKLDQRDREWARTVEDLNQLTEACEQKQNECEENARQCREFAADVERKVIFWE